MRAKHKAKYLREVTRVRRLQRAAAEAEVLRARTKVLEADRARAAAQDHHDSIEECWREIVSKPSLSVDISRGWAAALVAGKLALDEAHLGLADAQQGLDQKRSTLKKAMSQQELAVELSRVASRGWARQRDELLLGQMSDNWLQRKAQKWLR